MGKLTPEIIERARRAKRQQIIARERKLAASPTPMPSLLREDEDRPRTPLSSLLDIGAVSYTHLTLPTKRIV